MFMVLNNAEFETYKNKLGTVLVDPNYVSREDYDIALKQDEIERNANRIDYNDTLSDYDYDNYGSDMLMFYSAEKIPLCISNETTKLAFVDLINETNQSSFRHVVANVFRINKIIDVKDWEMWDDEKFCLTAIESNPHVLPYVKVQTEEICILAIKRNYTPSLEIFKIRTDKVLKLYEKVKKANDEFLSIKTVKQDRNALSYIKNHTEETCLETVKKDRNALSYVRTVFDD